VSNSQPLLEVKNLTKHFPVTRGVMIQRQVGTVRAVDGISFSIAPGETLGLVGESGCGKTTAGRTILNLYRPTSGTVRFDGVDVSKLIEQTGKDQLLTTLLTLAGIPFGLIGGWLGYYAARHWLNLNADREMKQLRQKMQIIFQDPYASLNPRWTVSAIVGEPLRVHNLLKTQKDRTERVKELLELVGLSPRQINRFPHEFSGGQRQRIGVARALASDPKFIVCDEPISALDVSIQAQVVNLLEDLQDKFGLTYLFIAHDLSMVRHICDRVAVMYLGVIVELTDCDEMYENPLHPYTQALLTAVPIPNPKKDRARRRKILQGEIPSPLNPPSGCRFHPRCPLADERCKTEIPEWRELAPGHFVACHKA
jgi:oligopeptide transport system ATP-binding protein